MATATSHNKKSSAVKRVLSEARELAADSSDLYTAAPLDDNIFEWHFTLRGPVNTEFAHGLYHGRILLPAEYPMRPPDLMLLTPNGRWELNKKICLTFTGFHEEMWQPAWGIRTALLGLQTFMTAKAEAAVGIGALDFPVQAREKLARESRMWKCALCEKTTLEMLPDPEPEKEGEGDRGKETLPEGLQVDLDAQSHKPPQDQASASSTETQTAVTTSSSTREMAGTPSPPVAQATAVVASNATAAAPPTAERTTAQPEVRQRPPPTVPARTTSSTPAAPSLPSTASNRISATEQKLTLIDNCIKALGLLVALLIVKRLI